MSNQALWAGCDLFLGSTGPGFSFFSSLPVMESDGVLGRPQCSWSARQISKVLHGPNSGVTRQECPDLQAWLAGLAAADREEVTKWAQLGSPGAQLSM